MGFYTKNKKKNTFYALWMFFPQHQQLETNFVHAEYLAGAGAGRTFAKC